MSATGPKNRIAVEGATGFLARAGYQKTQVTVLDFLHRLDQVSKSFAGPSGTGIMVASHPWACRAARRTQSGALA
jgi:hypothetical protein